MSELTEWVDLLSKVAAFVGAAYGIWNARGIREVHKLTNSLSEARADRAAEAGEGRGNIKGRQDLAAEQNAERKDR